MKLKPPSQAQLLATATLLTLASVVTAAEVEPNNTRAQANSLPLNASGQATTSGRINPLSDLDFFSVTTPSFMGQGTFVITMTPTSADHGLDAWIQLQNSSGTLLAERDAGFDNAAETLTFAQAVGVLTS